MVLRFNSLAWALVVMVACAQSHGQSEISLRGHVRVKPGASLVLRDVAKLSGAEAEALGDVVIIENIDEEPADSSGWVFVDTHRVHEAIDAQGKVHWGKIALSGLECAVKAVTPRVVEKTRSTRIVASAQAKDDGRPTLRRHIRLNLLRLLRVAPEDLRITFDESDDAFLDTLLEGQAVGIRQIGKSERMAMRITLYEGDVLSSTRTLRALVLVRRDVAIARTAQRRGKVIGIDDIATEERWMAAHLEPVAPENVIGLVARSTIQIGHMFTASDLVAPIVVKRGEKIKVHSIAGGFAVEIDARAMSDGRDGEVIEFQKMGTRDRKSRFFARVNGPGVAVVASLTARYGIQVQKDGP